MAVLDRSSGPYANNWVGEATRGLFKGIVDVSRHHLHVVCIDTRCFFENVHQSDNICHNTA